MSMEDLWLRQSVHGWVLFLGIKSVYNDYKQITEASASVGLLLATAVNSAVENKKNSISNCVWLEREIPKGKALVWTMSLEVRHVGAPVICNSDGLVFGL